VRGISLYRIKLTRPIFTKTIIRYASWIAGVMVALYLLFNFFTLTIVDIQLETNLDHHISHEIEHFMNTFYFDGDSLVIYNPAEFNESDLVDITESPFFLQIYSRLGKVYIRSKNLQKYQPIPLEYPEINNEYVLLTNVKLEDGEVLRTGYQKIYNVQREYIGLLQLSTPKSTAYITTKKILLFNLITFPLLLQLIIIISIFIARKSYEPIDKIINLANKISAHNLKERLVFDAKPNDEIGRLRDTLNNLFDRLEDQIQHIANFTDNASHQLMSPLTVINTELEYIEKKYQNDELSESIQVMHHQTRRMIHIVKTLLILAKECKDCEDKRSVFELPKLIEKEIKPIYSNDNITYDIEENLLLRGKKDYFSMVIQNLIDNAIKYSPPGSKVILCAKTENSFINISVEDNGFGINEGERHQLFERFYRGNQAQDDGVPGYGLGLSLVYSIVHAMNGTIEVKENQPNGSVFNISLPKLHTD